MFLIAKVFLKQQLRVLILRASADIIKMPNVNKHHYFFVSQVGQLFMKLV